MAIKQLDARIKHKRDTASNWERNNPVLLNGEIIIVDTSNNGVKFKTGDGIKTYNQLPFDDEAIEAKVNEKLTKPSGKAGQLLGFVSDNVIGAVDSEASDKEQLQAFSGILLTGNSWKAEDGKYYQDFSIPGITQNSNLIIVPNFSRANRILESVAWNTMDSEAIPNNGYIRFYSKSITSVQVPFIVLYVNKEAINGILTTNWIEDEVGYYQQINISSILDTQYPIIFPVWTSNKLNEMKAWNSINVSVETLIGAVKFYTNNPTTTNVNFAVVGI